MKPLDPRTAEFVLVDDDPFALKVLAHLLTRLGYKRVISCNSGQSALEWIEGSALVNLIFLDINMPGMDGVEFIRRLVQSRYDGAVVLVSGENGRTLGSVAKLLEAQNLLAPGSLQKPVNPALLASLLERLARDGAQQAEDPARGQPYTLEDLRRALWNGHIINHYQPKVSLASGELAGVEALMRWQHPVDGLVRPGQFMGLASQHGLMTELTDRVLGAAISQLKAWSSLGLCVPVAVNITMDDLSALEFPDQVAALVRAAGIDPQLLTLEVTEQQVMGKRSTVLDVLSRLRLKRFRLSIDDFGTGHSSLAQLRDLPADELKIDRGFVHGAASDPTRQAISMASLRMAHQLRMNVVAEGIETREDWEFVRRIGCDVGQGYFVAAPMPAAELAGWLAAWRTRQLDASLQQA